MRVAKSLPFGQICRHTPSVLRVLGCEDMQCLRSLAA